MKVCPVCHGHVEAKDAAANNRMVYFFGRFYYLMCAECKAAFMRNPDTYAGGRQGESARAPAQCDGSEGTNVGPCEPHRAA